MRRLALISCALASMATAGAAGARVLRVGTYHRMKGQYSTIQVAVAAAKPGDWILVGPGDYKTTSWSAPKGHADTPAGILITTARLRLRGMNRSHVIVDGTKAGSHACSRARAAQNFGPKGRTGRLGLNGILIWKARDVWVQNLTACNFLGGKGNVGNEIWWNGGDGSGKVGGYGFRGSYLNATSTFFRGEKTAAKYGIFSSNWSGGTWDHSYVSNFNDSGFYIGACQQVCDQTITSSQAEYNALGYSGSNSGGRLIVKNSEWDNNEEGFNTNSQNGDEPSPQDGSCPNGGISPVTHTHSCWVFTDNYVHDNNNPNVPTAGAAAAAPVGTGIADAGGRNDTFTNNTIVRNDAWGAILAPYPDSKKPCTGGTYNQYNALLGPKSCLFDEWSDAFVGNRFGQNGSYGHPSNGDFQELNFESGHPSDCYSANTEIGGGPLKPATAAAAQQSTSTCGGSAPGGSTDPNFTVEVLCDSQIPLGSSPNLTCPSGPYPRRTKVVMHPLPRHLRTMPNPCQGVPRNPWCPAHKGKK